MTVDMLQQLRLALCDLVGGLEELPEGYRFFIPDPGELPEGADRQGYHLGREGPRGTIRYWWLGANGPDALSALADELDAWCRDIHEWPREMDGDKAAACLHQFERRHLYQLTPRCIYCGAAQGGLPAPEAETGPREEEHGR